MGRAQIDVPGRFRYSRKTFGDIMSIVITGSIVGQEIYGSLKKDNEHGMVK